MAEYKSKHGIVSRSPYELYMSFADMRNFTQMLPEDKKDSVKADYDRITISAQGMEIGIRVDGRTPYSRIDLKDDGAPFKFSITLFFDPVSDNPGKTDFHVELEVELNLMMKMMIGGKIQQGLDKVVDSLVDISEGKTV